VIRPVRRLRILKHDIMRHLSYGGHASQGASYLETRKSTRHNACQEASYPEMLPSNACQEA
jgi:hypothetical protein